MQKFRSILKDVSREDIIKMPLNKLVMPLAIPALLQSLVISFNTIMDALYISRLVGKTAFSGVTYVSAYTIIITALVGWLSIGAGAMYSRNTGNDNHQNLSVILGYVLLSSFIVGIPIGSLFFILSEKFTGWIGVTEDSYQYGNNYLKVIMGGMAVNILSLTLITLVRCSGKMKRAFGITLIGVISNLILVPVFINLMPEPVTGAALATLVSYIIIIFFCLYELRFVKAVWPFRHANFMLLKDMVLIGLSSFLMQVSGFVKQFILYRMVLYFGNEKDELFFAAVQRLFIFAAMPLFGFLQALQPVVGINYGNSDFDRATRSVVVFRKYAILTLLLIATVCIVFHKPLIHLLLPGYFFNPEQFLQYLFLFISLIIAPLGSCVVVYWQAVGNKIYPVVMILIKDILLFTGITVLLTYWLGITGIYFGLLIENIVYAILITVLFNYRLKRFNA